MWLCSQLIQSRFAFRIWKTVNGNLAIALHDTCKLSACACIQTRLQSTEGFMKAGGFKGIYRGLGAAALGSAPGASLFFSSYDFASSLFLKQIKRRGIEDQRVSARVSHLLGDRCCVMMLRTPHASRISYLRCKRITTVVLLRWRRWHTWVHRPSVRWPRVWCAFLQRM